MLHCEAEGDFWVRIAELATVLGLLISLLSVVTAGATAGGTATGAAAGCAAGTFLLGPIGCFIGSILGGIIGGALGGGATAATSYLIVRGILEAIFAADPGDVEDANVGDAALGPIARGDRVAVLGEHVYDGFHQGWHELHPLMAVIKLRPDESAFYLEWDPTFPDGAKPPGDLPDMPADVSGLTVDDMRKGLNSERFAKRAAWLREKWCRMLDEAFDGKTRMAQQGLSERWTIHPLVDGCEG